MSQTLDDLKRLLEGAEMCLPQGTVPNETLRALDTLGLVRGDPSAVSLADAGRALLEALRDAERLDTLRSDFPETPFGQYVCEQFPEMRDLTSIADALLKQREVTQ